MKLTTRAGDASTVGEEVEVALPHAPIVERHECLQSVHEFGVVLGVTTSRLANGSAEVIAPRDRQPAEAASEVLTRVPDGVGDWTHGRARRDLARTTEEWNSVLDQCRNTYATNSTAPAPVSGAQRTGDPSVLKIT